MHGIWGSGPMSFCKALFVVDDSLDLSKRREVTTTMLYTVDVSRGILISSTTPATGRPQAERWGSM
jgi:3-polyprenyl-4-hydroxybenzoate decarboxylase